MEAFDAPRFDPLVVAERIEATEVLMMTPALPAVLAEILLDHDECVAAEAVLCRALTPFPTDVRLQQLMGLYHSRTGNLDAGLSFLDPCTSHFPTMRRRPASWVASTSAMAPRAQQGRLVGTVAPCIPPRLGAIKSDQRLHRHQRRDDGPLARPPRRSPRNCGKGPRALAPPGRGAAQSQEPRSIIGTGSTSPKRSWWRGTRPEVASSTARPSPGTPRIRETSR